MSLKIGNDVIEPEDHAKLLGITFDNNQKCNSQIQGKGGVISSLNQRLYMLRRLNNFVSKQALSKIADSIFTSKVRYGLQLLGKIRWSVQDPQQGDLQDIQVMQNKMLRLLNGTKMVDKISTKTLLSNLNMLSVNQMNAQIKITEAWKASHDQDYPLKIEKVKNAEECVKTRSVSNGDVVVSGKTELVQSTYLSDSSKAWNKIPNEIKDCKSIGCAKKLIKQFVAKLPI